MSSAGVGGLSPPLWWLLSMLCSATHVNTMSLTIFGLCSMVVSSTLNLPTSHLPKGILDHPLSPGYPGISYSLFSGQLSSALGLDQPRHKGKGTVSNLRSGKPEELHVPIEIQTSDDANFLARQKASLSRHVDSDTSLSEVECETLIASSDP